MKAVEPEVNDNEILNLAAAPEVLVEGYRGAMVRAGLVKLNFFANRLDPATGRVEKHAAVTLSIPLADFMSIAAGLGVLAQDIEKKEEGV